MLTRRPEARLSEKPRHLESVVNQALSTFRVVVIAGPRQSGKTTLLRRLIREQGSLSNLDEEETLRASIDDPTAFANFGNPPRAFDEVQRAGDPLIRAIKATVDNNTSPGQFLLTGSADFLTVPTISESLAGRAVFFDLWPFTQSEIDATSVNLIDKAFNNPDSLISNKLSDTNKFDYLQRICRGGFPLVTNMSERSQRAWFRSYVSAVIQRDIRELTGARRANLIPKILRLLAARTGNELVMQSVHNAARLGSRKTTADYLSYLEMIYLVWQLPAWSRNLSQRIIRRTKLHIADTGLAAHLLGKTPASLAHPTDVARGQLLETFVANEVLRQASQLDDDVRLYHFRDRHGKEIDLIAESADGRVVGIEVKSSSVATSTDARWLKWLRDKIRDDFVCGIVLYTGKRSFTLGNQLLAIPVSRLWTPQ